MDSANDNAPALKGAVTLEVKYFYQHQFDLSVQKAEKMENNFPAAPIRGGIFPHDITQGQFIAHFFQALAKQKPERIIIIGPNHFELSGSNVITTRANWQTEYGLVKSDQMAVARLLEKSAITQNDDVAANEHSMAAIMPFVSYYLSEATVVPIILKSEINLQDINVLSDLINEISDSKTVVVASVDFSHYLSAAQAERNDQETLEMLRTLDYKKIMSFGPRFNDYVDSPPSIALLLYWLSENNIKGFSLINHANSGILSGNTAAPTTSYFEAVYF